MRLVSLPLAIGCASLACAAAHGCAVPDVQFYPDDAAGKDSAASDAPADGAAADRAAADGVGADGPADTGAWSCPDAVPAGFTTCCGAIPCSGTQCSSSLLCNKCQQCQPDPGVVCCAKMNSVQCWVLDAGPCP
jgi:hypothetical protein